MSSEGFARNPSTTPKPSRLQSVVPLGRNISLYFWWLLETVAFFRIFAIKKFSGKHSCLTFDSCSCGVRYIKSVVSAGHATAAWSGSTSIAGGVFWWYFGFLRALCIAPFRMKLFCLSLSRKQLESPRLTLCVGFSGFVRMGEPPE